MNSRTTVTAAEAVESGLRVEVEIEGVVASRADEELLLTIHDHPGSDRSSWQPLRNENVFIPDGCSQHTHRFVLPSQGSRRFRWLDQRPFEEWRHIHNLHGSGTDPHPELRLPKAELSALDALKSHVESPESQHLRRQRAVSRSGFLLIAETRRAERISTVWTVELTQAPIVPTPAGTNTSIEWQLSKPPSGTIDDDSVMYRCHLDATLAQLDPPRIRHVPGRL